VYPNSSQKRISAGFTKLPGVNRKQSRATKDRASQVVSGISRLQQAPSGIREVALSGEERQVYLDFGGRETSNPIDSGIATNYYSKKKNTSRILLLASLPALPLYYPANRLLNVLSGKPVSLQKFARLT